MGARMISLAGLVLAGLVLPGRLEAQAGEDLQVTIGKSIVIDYPTDVGRISTSNETVVDAVAVSTREVLLHAKSHGSATVVIWAKTGQRTFYNISVEHDLEPLRRIMKDTFPDDTIQVQATKDSITLSGNVGSQFVADKATALAAAVVKTVVNNLRVAPNPVDKQILLRVKFAQLDRNYSKQFGFNLMSTGAANTPGIIGTGQFAPPRATDLKGVIGGSTVGTTSEFTLTDVLNVFAFRPDLNLAATVKALQSQGLLQILAEPNLVTTNGKEATFLVGGEFPIPILQGGSNAGAVTVQFREFGIRLTFNPKITPHQTMKMSVRPEVSSIDVANSITFNGFRIPALATRRIDTNIELAPGQSFVIGGLIDDRTDEAFNRVPGLSSIPLLGEIFKSRAISKAKTELMVLVTPEIVDPLNPNDPKPMLNWPSEFLPSGYNPKDWGINNKIPTSSTSRTSHTSTAIRPKVGTEPSQATGQSPSPTLAAAVIEPPVDPPVDKAAPAAADANAPAQAPSAAEPSKDQAPANSEPTAQPANTPAGSDAPATPPVAAAADGTAPAPAPAREAAENTQPNRN